MFSCTQAPSSMYDNRDVPASCKGLIYTRLDTDLVLH